MSTGKFDMAQSQARKIAELTVERDALAKAREEDQTDRLKRHTEQLNEITTQLALLVERTKDLPELSSRVTKLETWKAFVAGIAAAFTMIGGSFGYAVGLLVKK
jgi:translation elongation factor EF-1alpha